MKCELSNELCLTAKSQSSSQSVTKGRHTDLYNNAKKTLKGYGDLKKKTLVIRYIPFSRIRNSFPRISNSFPQIGQLVLSGCNSFPRIRQLVLSDSNSFPRIRQSVLSNCNSFPFVTSPSTNPPTFPWFFL